MKMKKIVVTTVIPLFVLFVFVGLFFSPSNAFAVKKGGTLKVAFGMTAQKLDPHATSGSGEIYIMANMFERLVSYRWNDELNRPEPIPSLAKRWEVSPDKLAVTFYLRDDVKFTDGTPFNAEAVKINIDRLMGPPPQSNARQYQFMIKNTEVVDEYTVKVNLKVPVVPLESMFCQSYIGMISPAAIEKWGDKVGVHPVGTGPYKLAEWQQGQRIVLEANMDHWKGRPNLDKVEFIFAPESTSRMNMVNTGQADMAFNLDVPDIEKVVTQGKLDLIEYPTTELLYLTLNHLSSPGNDMSVRRAIKVAIDRKGIVEKVLKGHATVSHSYVSPFCFGSYPTDPVIYDPKLAEKILTDGGWVDTDNDGVRDKNGNKLTITIRFPSGRYPMCDEVVGIIQSQLKKVGMNCVSEKMGYGAWITALINSAKENNGESYIVSWPSKEDARWAFYAMQDTSPLSFYQNQQVQELIKAQVQEFDQQKRLEMIKEIQLIAEKEAFNINLFFMNYNIAKHKNVHGVGNTRVPVSDSFNIYNAWIE